jgi:hypothetical protein
MSTSNPLQGVPEVSRRRSQRVILSLGIIVRTEDAPKDRAFEEETHTLIVNAHGALIALTGRVSKGQKLRLTNRATKQELVCQVVNLGQSNQSKGQIGIEFLTPSPDFWHISFPPEDWVLPESTSVTSDNG